MDSSGKPPHIVAVGGAHVDRRGQVAGVYVPGVSNPGTMREAVGGSAFGALRCAVRRGVSASLLSLRGGDAAGERVARAIAAAGIRDLSAVFLDRATPSYTALLDPGGELIAGLADTELYDLAFPRQVRRSKLRQAVAGADAVLCDANLPTAALEPLMKLAGGRPVFAIAVSPAKAVRLAPLLDRPAVLFMNRREGAALAGLEEGVADRALADALRDRGTRAGVVTAGAGPALGFDAGRVFAVSPPAPRSGADVTGAGVTGAGVTGAGITGAGDALAGATIAALLRGEALPAALREGVAAAMLAVEGGGAAPAPGQAAFAAALALVPEAREVA